MITGSARVVRDTKGAGLERLKRNLRGGLAQVYVGVPGGKYEEDGTPLALVAAANEFGTRDGRVPERSYLRAGIREGLPGFRKLNRYTLAAVAEGRMTETQALGMLGAAGVGAVKQKMQRGPFQANAPSTVKRKGSDKPLFDQAQLFQSITWVLEGQGAA